MVSELVAFYTVDILLCLWVSMGISSRRKGFNTPLLTDDPLDLGVGFGLWTGRGEIRRSIDSQ